MTVALIAVAGEAAAALLEPWPLKIVLDSLLPSKPLPGWLAPVIDRTGSGTLAILNFAVLAVAVIAVAGAASSYVNASIFVVKDHQLAERGTHEELLAAGGFYAELNNVQFGDQAPAA